MNHNVMLRQVIRTMTNGGVDYSFDCTGDPGVIKSALECCVEVSSQFKSNLYIL
jgi:Zn-dependent alcohol dehydrogenase